MAKQHRTVIRRIEGRKIQRVVDGQVADVTDRDGNVKRFWTLYFDYLRDRDVVERRVNVFPNQFSGGRDGETMFWTKQELQGLIDTIRKVAVGETVTLKEPVPATVERVGKYWELLDIGRSSTTAAQPAPPSPQQDAQVQQNTAAIAEIQGDMKQMMALLQQMVDMQQR